MAITPSYYSRGYGFESDLLHRIMIRCVVGKGGSHMRGIHTIWVVVGNGAACNHTLLSSPACQQHHQHTLLHLLQHPAVHTDGPADTHFARSANLRTPPPHFCAPLQRLE